LGSISYKDNETTSLTQQTQSIDTNASIVTEVFQAEEKILPEVEPNKQYEFSTNLLKVGDYNTAERAFKEFVVSNPEHDLAGSAQYWYAETFRIRQLYTDAASAYLEGYQKYPKSEKAPINLLKLGVSLVQIGEKDQGCLMITGVQKQYPKANQSVLQKAIYEEKKFECKKDNS
jgi:tol-pal system protein YbgF